TEILSLQTASAHLDENFSIHSYFHEGSANEANEIENDQEIEYSILTQNETTQYIPIKCIFCKIIPDTRTALFSHFRDEHGFVPGKPLDLCHIPEFLSTLQNKMARGICIYCEGVFPDTVVLRRHMRKKKHFRVNPLNFGYDRFYVINYADFEGRRWRDLEGEEDYEDIGRHGDSDSDFDDWEDDEGQGTMCLFDEVMLPTVADAVIHLKESHDFDLRRIQIEYDLDEYGIIRLINYIRSCSAQQKCFGCQTSFETMDEMKLHYDNTRHHLLKIPERGTSFWEDVNHLFPCYEDDPLLTWDCTAD
ncbi:hypothetical protein HK100_003884, partial [Physocladia obscura]